MNRASTPIQRASLKTAVKRVIAELGGLEAAATCTRAQKTRLAEYGAAQAPDAHMPADVILDLELTAARPLITEALCRVHGCLMIPVELPGEGDVARALQAVATDAGATLSDALRALSGGMSAPDMLTVQADLTELVRASQAALAQVNRRMGLHPIGSMEDRAASA
jgi:hypothetical protein